MKDVLTGIWAFLCIVAAIPRFLVQAIIVIAEAVRDLRQERKNK